MTFAEECNIETHEGRMLSFIECRAVSYLVLYKIVTWEMWNSSLFFFLCVFFLWFACMASRCVAVVVVVNLGVVVW